MSSTISINNYDVGQSEITVKLLLVEHRAYFSCFQTDWIEVPDGSRH